MNKDLNTEMPENLDLAQVIDGLITTDIPGRGFTPKAYEFAKLKVKKPLISVAANDLWKALGMRRGLPVIIATGATCQRPGLPAVIGEMDGPAGAIALARFLGRIFSAIPILATEEGQGKMLEIVARSAGMHSLNYDQILHQAANARYVSSVSILEISSDDDKANEQSEAILKKWNPAALVAIEKAGQNDRGKYHNSAGVDTSEGKARMEYLFNRAMQMGIPTIGIGDGGNEIGMGNIYNELIEAFPNLAKCKCGCGGSIASVVKTTSLIIATVSNWGAYGLITYLANILKMPDTSHTAWLEERILNSSAEAGYVNIDGYCLPEVDGLPKEIHLSIVRLLSALARWPFASFGKEGYARNVIPW